VALDSTGDVERAIEYAEQNPIKEGKKPQRWDFVTAFNEVAARRVRYRKTKRRIGGAALRSHALKMERERARRERRG
jgi:hypothetical protein